MEEKYMIQPVEETRATIFDSTIDLSMDISEIGIDMLFDDGVIKDIPAIGTVYKIGKIGYSVSRLSFIKKSLIFAQEMQRNNIGKGVLEKHKALMESNPKKYHKELELIIEYLNRQVGYEKSVLNARVYYLYLNENIDYDDFVLLLEIVDEIHLMDIDTLKQLYQREIFEAGCNFNSLACKRLHSCGVIDYFNGMQVGMAGDDRKIIARITQLGKVFCEAVLHRGREAACDK